MAKKKKTHASIIEAIRELHDKEDELHEKENDLLDQLEDTCCSLEQKQFNKKLKEVD